MKFNILSFEMKFLLLCFALCVVGSWCFSVISSSLSPLSYEEMKELDTRLQVLERTAPETLTGFFEPPLKSFSVKPGASRMSITSTCFALQAILATQEKSLYGSFITMDTKIRQLNKKDGRIPVQAIIKELLASEWREDDLFQVPLLLYTVLVVDSSRSILGCRMNEQLAVRLRKLVKGVLNARPQRRKGNQQVYSDYILFQSTLCYSALNDSTNLPDMSFSAISDDVAVHVLDDDVEIGIGGLPTNALPEGSAAQLSLALSRCAETSFNELCRQLALRTAEDRNNFDVMRLAYNLLTYVVATNSLAGTAGREVVRGQGPSPDSRVTPVNQRLVKAALAAFFAEQNESGLWDKGQPIYKSFRRTGRNIGNAFIFSVDTVSSLLEKIPTEAFRPHLTSLRKTLDWIEFHQTVEIIPDYCDPESGNCYGKSLRGWSSPHLSPETGPQAWSTAQTIECISRMRVVIESLTHIDVLNEFQGVRLSENGIANTAWDRLLDTDLGNCGTDQCRTLKGVLEERFILPFTAPSDGLSFGAAYSAILFGPPGTAKTTICEALAQRMGWDFLVIDTSVFLADGLSNVASRIRYVFERLQSLKECVILFDEIEEFCLDRETPGLGMESRMLTTAMLTAINDLRRAQKSVFFLATNRLRAFDAAITRPGRFDMQLFVGTPNLQSRLVQLQQKLADVPVDEATKEKAMDTYQSFLESTWLDESRFMNYLEGVNFASACSKIVAQGHELTRDEMEAILKSQAVVMTVRGQVREEFLASMDLTRL